MRLSKAEFDAMNGRIRAFFHRRVEFPVLVRLGLSEARGKDVVELGCGNGLGAALIAGLEPRSYVGYDLMPEQVALAEKRGLAGARFQVGDASSLPEQADTSADVVVIFGILHHVEGWRKALDEVQRVLRPGGLLVVEEPDARLLQYWDRVFRWDHPHADFNFSRLEEGLASRGFQPHKRVVLPGICGAGGFRKGTEPTAAGENRA